MHDAGDGWHDPLPTLYSALSVAHFAGESEREHRKLFDSMAGDMSWDGEPISGMSEADAALLAGARAQPGLSHRPNAIPHQSTSASTGSESRPGTKLWWNSSLIA